MRSPDQYFRAGVGAVVRNSAGHVLAFERSNEPGSWQLPQGGLDKDEEPATAVFREVREETGITSAALELVEQCPEPLAYELPPWARSQKTGRGQVQYWFLFRLITDDSAIDLTRSSEFSQWRWMPMQALVDCVVEFRVSLYRRLGQLFAAHLTA